MQLFFFFPSCCFEGRVQWLWYCSPPRKHLCTKIVFFFFFFFFKHNFFPYSCEVAFLTAQKYNQTFETWGLQGFKDDLCSEMIFLNLALFGSPDESGCGVMCSLMPFKCRRRLFVFSSLAFFTRLEMSDKNCSVLCSEVCPMLLSGRWWKHLSLSGFQMRELKE